VEGKALLTHVIDFTWTLPFLLYAETHYRFRYFFSLLRKSEPELIADAPHRIEPGSRIPLLILAKDADRFPARLMGVKVQLRQSGEPVEEHQMLSNPVDLKEKLWWKVIYLPPRRKYGWLETDVTMTIQVRGRTREYRVDNHRTSSHLPLRIFLAPEPLPRFQGLHFGDAHTHSDRTDDQVEFGIPISPAVQLSRSMGLSFFCVTDHSYDLDDSIDDYLRNDPDVPKWISLLEETERINAEQQACIVIPGEEVSCRNADGKNVHFLLLGNDRFIPGSGDGAERWSRTLSEHTITQILQQKQSSALAFASHPMEPVSFLQRLLLSRGPWSLDDIADSRLNGIQFANGIRGQGFTRGYQAWKTRLLAEQKFFCLAGNDAHGNFNRFRQIGIPFLTIREHAHQLFGKMRTAVFLEGALNQDGLMKSLLEGTFIITDGPVVNIRLATSDRHVTEIGKTINANHTSFKISAKSTKEFG
jgi:hypothetical protein